MVRTRSSGNDDYAEGSSRSTHRTRRYNTRYASAGEGSSSNTTDVGGSSNMDNADDTIDVATVKTTHALIKAMRRIKGKQGQVCFAHGSSITEGGVKLTFTAQPDNTLSPGYFPVDELVEILGYAQIGGGRFEIDDDWSVSLVAVEERRGLSGVSVSFFPFLFPLCLGWMDGWIDEPHPLTHSLSLHQRRVWNESTANITN